MTIIEDCLLAFSARGMQDTAIVVLLVKGHVSYDKRCAFLYFLLPKWYFKCEYTFIIVCIDRKPE